LDKHGQIIDEMKFRRLEHKLLLNYQNSSYNKTAERSLQPT